MQPEIQYRLVKFSPLRDRPPVITSSMMADHILGLLLNATEITRRGMVVVEVNIGAPQRSEETWFIAGVQSGDAWMLLHLEEQEQKALSAAWFADYTAEQASGAGHDNP